MLLYYNPSRPFFIECMEYAPHREHFGITAHGKSLNQESHFGLDDWLDFVRGLGSATQRVAMQEHLKEGCSKCARAAWLWGKVLTKHPLERQTQPPEKLVRMIRNYFDDAAPETPVTPEPSGTELAQVIFDSLRQALPAGVHALGSAPRQVLASSRYFTFDVRIQPVATGFSLVGQILKPGAPNQFVAGATVTLLNRDLPVAQTRTDSLGEFQLAGASSLDPGFTLSIGDGEKYVLLALQAEGE